MGTRADFWVGHDPDTMRWLGSIAWDGYVSGIPDGILCATDEKIYEGVVASFIEGRRHDDGTRPQDGWPWPWDDSKTTDYAYSFIDGRVLMNCYDVGWYDPDDDEQPGDVLENDYRPPIVRAAAFPNMRERKNVQFGGPKSGLLVVGVK